VAPAAPTAAFSAGLPEAPQPSKLLTGLGWASVSCGGLGLLMAWSTETMVVLTSLGILVAIAAIVWGIVRRRAGLGLPITGIVVCVGVLATVFASKLIIGDRFSGRRKLESTNRSKPVDAVDLDQAESEWVQFENDTQWTRAERPSRIGNMEVRVEAVLIDHATLNDLGTEQQSKDPYLIVRISVRNSDRDRAVNYRSWSGAGALTDAGLAALTDREGKSYPREDFGLGLRVADQVSTASVDPGGSVEDLLIFKATGKESDVYRLELPGSAVGEDGAFRFAIPATMIRRVAD